MIDPIDGGLFANIRAQAHGLVDDVTIVQVPRAPLEQAITAMGTEAVRWSVHRERLRQANLKRYRRRRREARKEMMANRA